jgi:hypothetical protein
MLPTQAAADHPSYAWSLRIIIRWMRLFGVDLGNSLNIICIFWLLLDVGCFGFEFYNVFLSVNDTTAISGLTNSVTTLLANIIDMVNWAGESLLTHLVLVFVTRNRWRSFWNDLMQLNSLLVIDEKSHRRLERYCWAGITYTVITVS